MFRSIFLLFAITICLAPVAQAQTPEEQDAAFAQLSELVQPNGFKHTKHDDGSYRSINFYKPKRQRDWPKVHALVLNSFPRLETLRLGGFSPDSKNQGDFSHLTELKTLATGGPGEAFMLNLAKSSSITDLKLIAPFTPTEGFAHLSEMTQLERLSLRMRHPKASEDFFDQIRGLDQLREFTLWEWLVHDTRPLVDFVVAHPSLEKLVLRNVDSQLDVVGAIQAVRPDLEIKHTPMTFINRIKWFDFPYVP